MRRSIIRQQASWDERKVHFTPDNLGLNFPWQHGSGVDWLSHYDSAHVQTDLDFLVSMGVKHIRTWLPLDGCYSYSGGADGTFTESPTQMAAAHDFLSRVDISGLKLIVVLADGNSATQPASLDGKVQWSLFKTPAGRAKYMALFTDFVTQMRDYTCIYAWETMNEPYGSGTQYGFSAYANSLSISLADVRTFLISAYNVVKAADPSRLVTFSEYEEEEQAKYRVFSDETFRRTFIEPATDVYSMHVYRPSASMLADFRGIIDKPLWLTEVGHINYTDPTASEHPLAGNSELYTARNAAVTRAIARKALNSGFSLVMPWSASENDHIVKHISPTKHALGNLGQWIKSAL